MDFAGSNIIKNYVTDENGINIRRGDEVLCHVINDTGHEEVIYLVESSIQVSGLTDKSESQSAASPTKKVNETSSNEAMVKSSSFEFNKNSQDEKAAWSSGPSKMLLDLYAKNLNEIGPMKKFRLKKNMWQYIADMIKTELKFECTEVQCANRYKTLMRDTTSIKSNNATSGNVRVDDEFEEQINNIKAIDDSIQPAVLMGIGQSKNFNKKIKLGSEMKKEEKKGSRSKSMINVLEEIHKEKERNKNKRHEEKLALIRSILKKDPAE